MNFISKKVECRYHVATRANELQKVKILIKDYKDAMEENIELIQYKYKSSC